MNVVRIGALNPPTENRSQWARQGLNQALEMGLTPTAVPLHEVTSFSATLPPALALKLKTLASDKDIPLSRITAGLLDALHKHQQSGSGAPAAETTSPAIPGQAAVRDILWPLLEKAAEGIDQSKIAFAEAATGTGKGRMIAALAADSASKGKIVVISAPLAVTWQLLEELKEIPEALQAGITMSLGRPNFVSPERLMNWAMESDRQSVIDWLENGAKPRSAKTIMATTVFGKELCWMLEDALDLAEDIPVDAVMLGEDKDDDCPAQWLYKSLRANQQRASIILCSHYMLASHIRILQIRGVADALDDSETPDEHLGTALPSRIDSLIVDEAHLLEQAFAAIYSHTLRLNPLIRAIETHCKTGRNAAVAALKTLGQQITSAIMQRDAGGTLSCQLDRLPMLVPHLLDSLAALEGIKQKSLDASTRTEIKIAVRAIKEALSGRTRLRLELTPVRHYPMLCTGWSNLETAFKCLWGSVGGAALVSATLYASDDHAFLTRWKLEVPPNRALFLPPVHPKWTTDPVSLQDGIVRHEADDSDEWADEAAIKVAKIAEGAIGGTLVLCTSFQNASQLYERLKPKMQDRLIIQSRSISASICASQFRAYHYSGKRPVWIGLGAAWTGIDLTDRACTDPAQDTMLSDLVITRLPLGLNRTLTHERRLAIAGFKVVTAEALWHFRQGLGRLVRRPGVKNKKLWVLDCRFRGDSPWTSSFRRLLDTYRK